MIIDFHAHFSQGEKIEDLIIGMDKYGVDICGICTVVRPGSDSGASSNKALADAVRKFPDRLIGYAGVIPYAVDATDTLTRCIEKYGFRALKIHPSMQQFFPSDQRIYAVIQKAIDLDIPILIHTGAVPIPNTRSRYDDPMEIDDLALVFPEAKLVMAHGDPFGPGPAIAGKHPNVYMDTTTTFSRFTALFPGLGEDTLKFMGLVRPEQGTYFGSQKTIFGTDANPTKVYRIEENIKPLMGLNIPDEEKMMILGGNAAKLLKISK